MAAAVWARVAAALAERLDRITLPHASVHHASQSSHLSASPAPSAPSSPLPHPLAPTAALSAALGRFAAWLLRLLLQLPWILFGSDPAAFLPPKEKRHHSHSRHSSKWQAPPAGGGVMSAAAAAASAAAAHALGGSHKADGSAPPAGAPPSVPFLSASAFPIPSSQLEQAQYCFNLHQPPHVLGELAHSAAAAVSSLTGTPLQSIIGSTPAAIGGLMSGGGAGVDAQQHLYQHVLKRKKKKKFTLVLDLDETLVHTTDKAIAEYDCRVEIHTKKAHRVFYILKRPFLDVFLVTLSQYFEIVIFTASIRRYADAVIDLVDVHHVVDRRFFRQSCIKSGNGSFLKDLRVVSGGDLRRTLLVDNSPVAYQMQEENALPIATWYDDPEDTALRDLMHFLLALRAMDDVRPLLYRRHVLQQAAMRASRKSKHAVAAAEAPQISSAAKLVEADEREGSDVGETEQLSRIAQRRLAHRTL